MLIRLQGRIDMDVIRVLIADDHEQFRESLRGMLATADDTEFVGEATTGTEVVTLARERQPDVILMDLQMPGQNGIEATRQIVRDSPHIGVVMLTMFDDDHSVFAAMRAGARGYVLKGAKRNDLLRAVRAVGIGEAIFSPSIAARMVTFFGKLQTTAPRHILPGLTDRERELLVLIAQGCKNAEIAESLVISPKTVRNHITNILSKLQAADRTQAILMAREAGLG